MKRFLQHLLYCAADLAGISLMPVTVPVTRPERILAATSKARARQRTMENLRQRSIAKGWDCIEAGLEHTERRRKPEACKVDEVL